MGKEIWGWLWGLGAVDYPLGSQLVLRPTCHHISLQVWPPLHTPPSQLSSLKWQVAVHDAVTQPNQAGMRSSAKVQHVSWKTPHISGPMASNTV